ncbi:MAG TPA: 4-hydroxythreonine-4-phosphate dehydrogenase PdxA [Salinivirga sp.]|uniref:4-hydroxythreonine-4-phosphate dehydrogenase PdxA n=1 Tax=Salinivirga sp. TaxID=1970192 RepID=UPI002B47597F|nr:4-hydroxythreonine-4-phosphate dehydrogenase PdxA [Salinivirga sp.]HKK59625.1 4-hydroxythreonine-4-phosphate dehydrogenase PdxA [Salinivirga sp.]
MRKDDKIKVGISHGDINGISYEIIIKALQDNRLNDSCTPILYGSPKVAAYHRKALDIENFSFNAIRKAEDANPKRANLINVLDDNVRVELGKSTKMAGECSVLALDRMVHDMTNGLIDAMVTAPICKENIQQAGFSFPGHTEYLQKQFNSEDVLMLMVFNELRVGVVTGHIPLKDAPETLTKDLVYSKIKVLHESLLKDFALSKGKIAVLGLNPHAGDNGIIGTEDRDIIQPAIEKARQEGIMAVGPFPSDGFFGSGGYNQYDAVLAMYHDQGLIPFKVISQGEGVNYTAGLSVVRTSPGHGTAFDIVGKDLGNPASLRNAIYLASDISRNRWIYEEASANPLEKQSFDAGPGDVDISDLESDNVAE